TPGVHRGDERRGVAVATPSASPGRLDSTVRVRAARRNPGRSRATRSARASAGAPTGAGAVIGPADPPAGSRVSRSPETDSRSATGAATPHLVDRVSAGAAPLFGWSPDVPPGT